MPTTVWIYPTCCHTFGKSPTNVKDFQKIPTNSKRFHYNLENSNFPGGQSLLGDFSYFYNTWQTECLLYFRYQDGEYGNIGIELNIRDFDGNGQSQNAIYILLDGLIGEYDITMGIDWIEWVKLDESNIENLNPITQLRTLIDSKKD